MKTINAPNYKAAGIGYTLLPTCVTENPKKWGMKPNEYLLWSFLASRVNKDQYFNGRTLAGNLHGVMGKSAVGAALKNLCNLGFCTKRPKLAPSGQYMGWEYQFFTLPKSREIVDNIDQGITEKLDSCGWFGNPDLGYPHSGGEPDNGNPCRGDAPSNEIEGEKKKELRKEKTPSPLSEKEEVLDLDSGERNSEEDLCPSPADHDPGSAVTGRHRTTMLGSDSGSRFLKLFKPEQIPGDKALRWWARAVEKGELPHAYVTFLEEKIIVPNQIAAKEKGNPLKSIAEILELSKTEAFSFKGQRYRDWSGMRMRSLKDRWTSAHNELDLNEFNIETSQLGAEGFGGGFDFVLSEAEVSSDLTPFRVFIYGLRSRANFPGYFESELVALLNRSNLWSHLLGEAAVSQKEFISLEKLVALLGESIAPDRAVQVAKLREDWICRHQEAVDRLRAEFARFGATPPAIKSTSDQAAQ